MTSEFSSIQKHNKELLTLLTQHLPDMLWVKERNGNYLYTNQAICDGLLMADNTMEPIGKNDMFFAQREREKYPENPNWHTFGELCFNSDLVVIENKKPMKFEEYGNVKGKMLYLEVYKAPFFDNEGNVIGTVGAGRDITALKQIQTTLEDSLIVLDKQKKELELFNQKLEQRVEEEMEKRKQHEHLMLHQSRQAAMGELLESIAHQWRQPLNIISLAASNLETKYYIGEMDVNDFAEKMNIISKNIDYMSHTIDDFRRFLQPDEEKKVFFPYQCLEDVGRILSAQLENNRIKTTFHLEENFRCEGIENEFKQVAIILVNNSIDAIKLRRKEKKIEHGVLMINLYNADGCGIIEIIDNGGGIDDSIIEKIFDPYFTTKKALHGTGVGLYIAKSIIESRVGGKISVENVENGAKFIIKMRIAE